MKHWILDIQAFYIVCLRMCVTVSLWPSGYTTSPLPTTHIRKKVSSLATLPVYQRTVFSCTHVSTTEREKKCTDGNSTRCSDRVPKSSLLFRICKKYQTPIISKNEGKNKKINAFQYIVLPIVLTSFKYIYMYIWYIYEANILQRGI